MTFTGTQRRNLLQIVTSVKETESKILPSLLPLHSGLASSVAREERDKFTPSAVTHTPVHFSWGIDHVRLETHSSWITFSWVLFPIPLYCHFYTCLTIKKCCQQNTESSITVLQILIYIVAYYLILLVTVTLFINISIHRIILAKMQDVFLKQEVNFWIALLVR